MILSISVCVLIELLTHSPKWVSPKRLNYSLPLTYTMIIARINDPCIPLFWPESGTNLLLNVKTMVD